MKNYIHLSIILAFLDFSTANSQQTTNDLAVIYRFDEGVIFYIDLKNATQSENKSIISQQSLQHESSMENLNFSNSSLQHERYIENFNSLSLQHEHSSNSSLQHEGSTEMKLGNNKHIRKSNLKKHYQSVIYKKEQIKRNYEIKKNKELKSYPIAKLEASNAQRSEKDPVFRIFTRQITRAILKQILMQIVIFYAQLIMSFACTTAILIFVGRLKAVVIDMQESNQETSI